MGYYEIYCQLCGAGFNIGRFRSSESEPLAAAWRSTGDDFAGDENIECEATGCKNVIRKNAHQTLDADDDEDDEDDEGPEGDDGVREHIAGPNCEAYGGYNGNRITAGEMKGCNHIQCIFKKTADWQPEPEDEDYVLRSRHSWVTGISVTPPDESDVSGLGQPSHNNDDEVLASNQGTNFGDEEDPLWGLPMHPACFSMFQRMSKETFGYINIDGLRELWLKHSGYPRWGNRAERPDVANNSQQWWDHTRGTEYLAANPLEVPGLERLIQSCVQGKDQNTNVIFADNGAGGKGCDPFASLPPEVKLMVILRLDPVDVAQLRLSSRSFKQLPQAYFHSLVTQKMPWIPWDLDSEPWEGTMDWYKLWCKLSAADGGSGRDEEVRDWLSEGPCLISWWNGMTGQMGDDFERRIVRFPDLAELYKSHDTLENKKSKLAAMTKAKRQGEGYLGKATELRGLRNRRRIYNDIQETLRRIRMQVASHVDEDGGSQEVE